MTEEEKIALGYLPDRLREAAVVTMGRYACPIAEIRLRLDGAMSLTVCGTGAKNAVTGALCSKEEITAVVDRLCGGSMYAHAETIREGVIVTAQGLRAGISGRAVVTGGKIECVRDISSVNIRIPHRVPGAADRLYDLVRKYGSTCVISPPGMGKTTMLRELIPLLSKERRVAVIDTRYELGAGMPNEGLADFYPGWPRSEGILAAVRTMSPDWIICDEISDDGDRSAILAAVSAGVGIVASAHGRSIEEVRKNPRIGMLFADGVFGCVCGADGGILTA